jgi:hypothetical protein
MDKIAVKADTDSLSGLTPVERREGISFSPLLYRFQFSVKRNIDITIPSSA